MASHAWYQGFAASTRKAFVSDGSAAIEKVHSRWFGQYTAVLDLMHALSYCLAAARATSDHQAIAWQRYMRWAEWIWQGRVDQTLAELDQFQQQLGNPTPESSSEDPREVLRAARVYFSNQKGRMDYPAYRRQGFPLTSSIMESTVKQVNRRVKGSEKFWSKVGGDVILTLRGEYLSDHQPMSSHWAAASRNATGQRAYQTAT